MYANNFKYVCIDSFLTTNTTSVLTEMTTSTYMCANPTHVHVILRTSDRQLPDTTCATGPAGLGTGPGRSSWPGNGTSRAGRGGSPCREVPAVPEQ